jgi:hypothetical protein
MDELAAVLLMLMGGPYTPAFASFAPPGNRFTEGLYGCHGKPQYRV